MKLKKFLKKMKKNGEINEEEYEKFKVIYAEIEGSLNDNLEEAEDTLTGFLYGGMSEEFAEEFGEEDTEEKISILTKILTKIDDYINRNYIKENSGEPSVKITGIPASNEWHSDVEIVEKTCPHLTGKSNIFLSKDAMFKILYLLDKFPEKEWMGLLTGRKENEGYLVENIIIPPQKNTSVHTEMENDAVIEVERGTYSNIIGWIHSHNKMSAFFSAEDRETASRNDVSIVVNNNMEFDALVRIKLPCGHIGLIKGEIKLQKDEEMERIIKENIKDDINVINNNFIRKYDEIKYEDFNDEYFRKFRDERWSYVE